MEPSQGQEKPAEPACCGSGCGYPSPLAAMRDGAREKILYVTCIRLPASKTEKTIKSMLGLGKAQRPDFLATVDVDPGSDTYGQVIHRLEMTHVGDELHHFGWNACSSCFGVEGVTRSKLIVLSLMSSNIYVVDVSKGNERAPRMHKVIEREDLEGRIGSLNPHTTHCLPSRQVMVSMLGDKDGNARGSFLLLDSETFEILGTWEKEGEALPFGYSFWYQPHHNVMISSEWGAPRAVSKGFLPHHVKEGLYGHSLHVWDWKERKHLKTIDLGEEGQLTFEVRFLHNPKESQGYVGCALSSNVFRLFKNEKGDWDAEKVIDIPAIKVRNWQLPELPGLLTDNLISLDDKYLYLSLYLQGDVRQYDITDRRNPKLVGKVFLGGSYHKGTYVYPDEDDEQERPDRVVIKGKTLVGGPHKLQLSLDGKRLYVTNSLFSRWDEQFYPELIANGSTCVKLDVDTENGGLALDENFLVDFGDDINGPALAHEIRYPGGDCTSDIWLARDD